MDDFVSLTRQTATGLRAFYRTQAADARTKLEEWREVERNLPDNCPDCRREQLETIINGLEIAAEMYDACYSLTNAGEDMDRLISMHGKLGFLLAATGNLTSSFNEAIH